jgi:hypothetical protein
MERDEALAVLGLDPSADAVAVRAAYRRLARLRHPDRGGDDAAFAQLHAAARVLTQLPGPGGIGAPAAPPERVARGRPSREPRQTVEHRVGTGAGDPAPIITGGLEEGRRSPSGPDPVQLDRLLLQRLSPSAATAPLEPSGHRGTVGSVGGPGILLRSRAPGSPLNRFATTIATGGGAEFQLTPLWSSAAPDRALRPAAVVLLLAARSRGARRAVAGFDPLGPRVAAAAWRRERGDARVVVRTRLDLRDTPTTLARDAVVTAVALLEALTWPLSEWRLEPPW